MRPISPPAPTATGQHRDRLRIVLALVASYTVVEAIGGWQTGSLALLADAAHMLTDVAALVLALIASWLAGRPSATHRTYGHYRVEILAAHANAVLMLLVSGSLLWECYRRLLDPPAVKVWPVILVAAGGLMINGVSAWLLRDGARASLNVRGAFLEVLGDLLASAGVVIAGIIIIITGWQYADPLISAGIALFLLPRAWTLLRQATDILLETAPPHVEIAAVAAALRAVPGVRNVHDLHVWTITSGMESVTAHLVLEEGIDIDGAQGVLDAARRVLNDRFGLDHATLQLERRDLRSVEVPH